MFFQNLKLKSSYLHTLSKLIESYSQHEAIFIITVASGLLLLYLIGHL